MIKKLLKIFFAFLLIVVSFSFIKLKTKATITTSGDFSVIGAQIRTDEKAGIRFVADFDGYSAPAGRIVSKYGMVLALGEVADLSTLYKGATVNGKEVAFREEAAGGDTTYLLTVWNIPEEYYAQGLTARAYLVLDNDEVVYSATVKERSLADVALQAKSDGTSGTFINTIVTYASNDLRLVYESRCGNYVVVNPIYCYDPAKLAVIFIADYNEFVDTDDEVESITSKTKATAKSLYFKSKSGADFYYSAKGTKWADIDSGKETSVTDVSTSNLYLFFNDPTYSAKWGWLLDLISAADGGVHTPRQVNAVKGTGVNASGLYSCQHLITSIIDFFTESYTPFYYAPTDFGSSSDKYAYYDKFYSGSYANTTVFNDGIDDGEIVEVGDTIILPGEKVKTGYSWNSYKLSSVGHAAGSSYTVTTDAAVFIPSFDPIVYDIVYHLDGGLNGVGNPVTYTIETATINLADPSKDGFAFAGWYDNGSFTGDPITSITKGSYGEKNLYAKFVPVRLAVNGSWTGTVSGTVVNYNEMSFTYGVNAFDSMSSAAALFGTGQTVYVAPGTYSEAFTIGVNNLRLQGPNDTISAVDGVRGSEAIFTNVITITTGVANTTITGFKFTGAGQVYTTSAAAGSTTTGLDGFTFTYNYVDKGSNTTPAILFNDGNRVYARDILIDYCYFTAPNLAEVVEGKSGLIYTMNNVNLTVKHSKFYNIKLNAVASYDTTNGKGAAGDIIFEDNTFIDVVKGAIWMQFHSPLSGKSNKISIKNNYFENVDGSACVDFEGNNASDVYASVRVELNVFKNVFKCLWRDKSSQFVFTNNVVYKDDTPTTGYISRGTSGYTTNCASNLYLSTDGSTVYTSVYSTDGSTGFKFDNRQNNVDASNYATIAAYNEATGKGFSN